MRIVLDGGVEVLMPGSTLEVGRALRQDMHRPWDLVIPDDHAGIVTENRTWAPGGYLRQEVQARWISPGRPGEPQTRSETIYVGGDRAAAITIVPRGTRVTVTTWSRMARGQREEIETLRFDVR